LPADGWTLSVADLFELLVLLECYR